MKTKIKNIWSIACYPLLYIAVQGIASFVCVFIAGIIVGIKNAQQISLMTQEEITQLVMDSFSIHITLLITVIFVFLFMFLLLKKEWKLNSFWQAKNLNAVLIAVCVVSGIGLNLFTIGTINLTQLTTFFPDYEELMGNLVGDNLLLELICIGVLIPLLEEVVFRGVAFGRLRKMTKLPIALVLQAFIFGLIHFNVLQSSYAAILGLILGLIYLWSDSIWAVFAAHAAYNLTSLILSYVFDESELSSAALLIMTLIGVVISVFGVMFCAKREKNAE